VFPEEIGNIGLGATDNNLSMGAMGATFTIAPLLRCMGATYTLPHLSVNV